MTFNFKRNKNDSAIQNRTTIDVTMIVETLFNPFAKSNFFGNKF